MTALPAVLGLDLSTRRTGVAFPDGGTYAWTPLRPNMDSGARLHVLLSALTATLRRFEPALLVVEDVAPGTYPLAVKALGKLQGVAELAAYEVRTPIVFVNPSTLKRYATGRGNADKEAMVAAAEAAGAEVGGHDEADAWLLRALGVAGLGGPDLLDGPDPGHRLEVVAKHTWPVVAR